MDHVQVLSSFSQAFDEDEGFEGAESVRDHETTNTTPEQLVEVMNRAHAGLAHLANTGVFDGSELEQLGEEALMKEEIMPTVFGDLFGSRCSGTCWIVLAGVLGVGRRGLFRGTRTTTVNSAGRGGAMWDQHGGAGRTGCARKTGSCAEGRENGFLCGAATGPHNRPRGSICRGLQSGAGNNKPCVTRTRRNKKFH